MPEAGSGGLGPQLVGEKITLNNTTVTVIKQLGEGGFSFVYLVKDMSDGHGAAGNAQGGGGDGTNGSASQASGEQHLVLKITSIHSRQQRDIAEKEAKLLSRLSHPSIVRMFDTCYRSPQSDGHGSGGLAGILGGGGIGGGSGHGGASSLGGSTGPAGGGVRPQHLILMEYCEGGHALDVCNRMSAAGERFDLPSLVIAFGQICNAVSYLHAQRPPIVHRDLKPVNFLVKGGAYKLCDFGSAVFGHVDLKTSRARTEAEEVIEKTTTQMFRAPEMVDLYMAKKLTQSTDVWALGCCLYSLAFFQNCFEEGSNLAILSRNYKIPEDNPYGEGLVELIDRMLTVDYKARADMTEVILCLSAIYSGRPLPARKKTAKLQKSESAKAAEEKRVGTYRTDGQGILKANNELTVKAPKEAKKLNPNSAAARRRRAMQNASDPQLHCEPAPASTSGSPSKSANARDMSSANDRSAFNAFSDSFLGVKDEDLPTFEAGGAFGNLKVSDENPSSSEKGSDAFEGGNDNALFSAFDSSDTSWPQKTENSAGASGGIDGFAGGDVFADFGGTQGGHKPLNPISEPRGTIADELEDNMNHFGALDDENEQNNGALAPLSEVESSDGPSESLVAPETKKKSGFGGLFKKKK